MIYIIGQDNTKVMDTFRLTITCAHRVLMIKLHIDSLVMILLVVGIYRIIHVNVWTYG